MIYDYGPTYYYARQRKSRKRTLLRVIFFFALLGVTYITVFIILKNNSSKQAVAGAITQAEPASQQTPLSGVNGTLSVPTPSPTTPQQNQLQQIVKNSLKNTKATYGIVILNLKTKEYYTQNEHRPFLSASLYKLWVMGEAHQQIKTGSLRETDKISADIDSLYQKFNLASPSAKASISTTITNAIEKMITISDNTTALLLSSKLKLSNIKTFLKDYNFTASKLGTATTEPVTTPYDVAIFMQKLYAGELIDKPTSDKMLTILKRQRLKNKLPKYLPPGTLIAHKTGELDKYSHDAGIVYTDKGDYIIVVMSESDIASRKNAEERIASLSRDVHNYFTQNNPNPSNIP
jgi:beta-lactamase class A